MSHLIMHRGPERWATFRLEDDEITIGRDNKNTITIRDNEISRVHVRLFRTETGYELHDQGSSNGTFINGIRVDDVWLLESQCLIELGDTVTLEYRPDDTITDMHIQADPAQQGEDMTLSYLVVLRTGSQQEPAVYPLDSVSVVVGRSTETDVVVVEPEMSREHFRITLAGGAYFIEDLQSMNGTLVNKEKLEDIKRLHPGDTIQVGERIHFQFTNSPERFSTDISTEVSPQGISIKRKTSPGMSSVIGNLTESVDVRSRISAHTLQDEVLIVYAREDWETLVKPMVDQLYQDDIAAWVDQYLVEGSDDWIRATSQAQLECWLLVIVVSPQALKSEMVKTTWRHFHNREKPIILVIHQPVDNPPFNIKQLTRIQYNPGLPDVAFQQLIGEIKRLQQWE